jgi:hypothetical protein
VESKRVRQSREALLGATGTNGLKNMIIIAERLYLKTLMLDKTIVVFICQEAE